MKWVRLLYCWQSAFACICVHWVLFSWRLCTRVLRLNVFVVFFSNISLSALFVRFICRHFLFFFFATLFRFFPFWTVCVYGTGYGVKAVLLQHRTHCSQNFTFFVSARVFLRCFFFYFAVIYRLSIRMKCQHTTFICTHLSFLYVSHSPIHTHTLLHFYTAINCF